MSNPRENGTGTRSRSNTSSSQQPPTTKDEQQQQQLTTTRPLTRPPHLRSRSYLSSSDVKPFLRSDALSKSDAENETGTHSDFSASSRKKHRLHLPGHRHTHSKDHKAKEKEGHKDKPNEKELSGLARKHHGHRYTRSELPPSSGGGVNHGASSQREREGGEKRSLLRPSHNRANSHHNHGNNEDGSNTGNPLNLVQAAYNPSQTLARITSNKSGKSTQRASNHSYEALGLRSSAEQSRPQHKHQLSHQLSNLQPPPHPGLRRRATSDPKYPSAAQQHQPHQARYHQNYPSQFSMYYNHPTQISPSTLHEVAPTGPAVPQSTAGMTEVELLLYKADRSRKNARSHVSSSDVQKLTTQLKEGQGELHERLTASTRTASDFMRRLDDAHDSLLRSVASLIDTITSFQNITTQAQQLSTNFSNSVSHLENTTFAKLNKQRKALFEDRGKKLQELEKRGTDSRRKAQELDQRLEDCKSTIRRFEERERTKRRAQKGVVVGVLWGIGIVLTGLMLGLGTWAVRKHKGVVRDVVEDVVNLNSNLHPNPNTVAIARGGETIVSYHGLADTKSQLQRYFNIRTDDDGDSDDVPVERTAADMELISRMENLPPEVHDLLQRIATRHFPETKQNKKKKNKKVKLKQESGEETYTAMDEYLKTHGYSGRRHSDNEDKGDTTDRDKRMRLLDEL